MSISVNDRCRTIATFRHISIKLMETVAGWTPTTPEMEAKVMFGRHIWDYAQMADWLGKRTLELRRHEHYTLRPVEAYDALLHQAAAVEGTGSRISALYNGLVPGLVARYRRYRAATDPILDEPSVVIIDRIVGDLERHRSEVTDLLRDLKLKPQTAHSFVMQDNAIIDIVAKEARA
jgi:hypothetical protein